MAPPARIERATPGTTPYVGNWGVEPHTSSPRTRPGHRAGRSRYVPGRRRAATRPGPYVCHPLWNSQHTTPPARRGRAGATGVEPATTGFGDQSSSALSYTPRYEVPRYENAAHPRFPGAAGTARWVRATCATCPGTT